MIRRPMRRLVALLLPVLALAGCAPAGGGVDTGKFKGDAKKVAKTLDDLADAGRRGDAQRICSQLLSRRRVDALDRGGRTCSDVVDDQVDDADVFTLDVDSISVTGNTATARVRSQYDGDKVPRTALLVRESGRWRLDGIRR
jgi:hypothetical protein